MKEEKTFTRVSPYNLYRRNFGPPHYALDIDWIEYRPNKGIVALICTTGRLQNKQHIQNSKKFIWIRTKLERKIMKTIADKLKVKAYYVIHTEDLSYFEVFDLDYSLNNPEEMNQNQYSEFIKCLRKEKFLHEFT